MGIKYLNKLVHKTNLDINTLINTTVAIDAQNWVHTYLAVARKIVYTTDIFSSEDLIFKELYRFLVDYISRLSTYKIKPIFVFDGTSPPEKKLVLEKRKAKNEARRLEVETLYEQIKSNSHLIPQLKKALVKYKPKFDFALFKQFLASLNISYIQAVSESEQLCSMLCREKIVSIVVSKDTDVLAYLCPYACDFKFSTCVRLNDVLGDLKLEPEVFVDVCIMAGCDFNTNIPNYSVMKAYNLLLECNSIDNLPKKFDITCLNHHRCRELFKYVPSASLIEYESGLVKKRKFVLKIVK
jgi:flap endonuclease-1